MNFIWAFPLLVMALAGMSILLLRGRPVCVRSNAHQLSVLSLSASSVIGLARMNVPSFEVILMAYAAAVVVVLSATREIARRKVA